MTVSLFAHMHTYAAAATDADVYVVCVVMFIHKTLKTEAKGFVIRAHNTRTQTCCWVCCVRFSVRVI